MIGVDALMRMRISVGEFCDGTGIDISRGLVYIVIAQYRRIGVD